MKQAPKSVNIGAYGGIPSEGMVETTVLTVGGETRWGFVITILHVITWVTAICLISLWGNAELSKLPAASDAAKMLGTVYAAFIGGILLMAIVHASCASRDLPVPATLASVMLLTMIGFENSLGCAYVAYSLVLGNSNFYGAAIISQLFVCLGSAMIVAFYVNWSHNGNLNIKDWDFLLGSGPTKA